MNSNIKKSFLATLFAITAAIPVIAQETAQQYFTVDEMPDLTSVLPPPPDTTSAQAPLYAHPSFYVVP